MAKMPVEFRDLTCYAKLVRASRPFLVSLRNTRRTTSPWSIPLAAIWGTVPARPLGLPRPSRSAPATSMPRPIPLVLRVYRLLVLAGLGLGWLSPFSVEQDRLPVVADAGLPDFETLLLQIRIENRTLAGLMSDGLRKDSSLNQGVETRLRQPQHFGHLLRQKQLLFWDFS